jgi:hypothetical protein
MWCLIEAVGLFAAKETAEWVPRTEPNQKQLRSPASELAASAVNS